MIDKAAAQKELNALLDRVEALNQVINAPDVLPSLLTKPVPGSGDSYYCISSYQEEFTVDQRMAHSEYAPRYAGNDMFQNRPLADDYAKAFSTFLALRHQPGTVPAALGTYSYIIRPVQGTGVSVDTMNGTYILEGLSPAFKDRASACAAVDKLGADNILHMMKTFHHMQ